jgi:ribonucleoside-diphosphate reductase alpha chain
MANESRPLDSAGLAAERDLLARRLLDAAAAAGGPDGATIHWLLEEAMGRLALARRRPGVEGSAVPEAIDGRGRDGIVATLLRDRGLHRLAEAFLDGSAASTCPARPDSKKPATSRPAYQPKRDGAETMTTAEIPGREHPSADDQGGLGPLGYKIFLDRYAHKDMTKKSIAPGDTVVVVVDQKTGQREIGTVTARSDSTVAVELRDGGTVQQAIEHVDKPLETHPAQMVARVARGIAAVEAPAKQEEWRRNFEWLLSDWRFIPGGRILAAAGTDQQLTFYNCFQGDTLVHTREGIVPIGNLEGEHEVLSEGGIYRKAFFRSYGQQRLWKVQLNNGTVIEATGDHQWVVSKPKGGTKRVSTRDLKGHWIPINPRPVPPRNADFDEGVRHGIVFGDGSMQYGWAHVCLFGESEVLAERFAGYSMKHAGGTVATKAHIRVQRLPAAWKQLPRSDASPSYWRGFIAGLISADGHVDSRGSVMLHNKNPEVLGQIAEGMAIAGLVASSVTLTREISPFDGSNMPLYKLQFFKSTITPEDLLLPSHRENFERSPRARTATIQVIDVRETDRVEEVFCCVEPETHTITIGHGYLTGQCFVIPSPKDSRRGIIETLSQMMEIMSRGGGVGINVSSLRPKHAYVKGVNGRSSGAVSWGGLYSFVTGLIEQGGSRRGALMLILNDWHPDLLEFISAKREMGRITNANISVAISDAFMKAVHDDADWPLVFPDTSDPDYDEQWDGDLSAWKAAGRPVVQHRTVKARAVWNQIIESAWASAEPGVFFVDRYNSMSNSWYYAPIMCTNPCVTGDTLIATADGLKTAYELFSEAATVQVVTDSRLSADPVVRGSNIFATGVKPVYRLTTSEGFSVRLTADHRVRTEHHGWVEAQDLQPGDKILVQNRGGGFGAEGSLDLGRVLGWLVGDGHVRGERAVLSFFGEKEGELASLFAEAVNRVIRPAVNNREYRVGATAILARNEVRVSSNRLRELAAEHGLVETKLRVPDAVLHGTREMQQGFLQALYTADGHVECGGGSRGAVVLTSVSMTLLQDVQRLLLNFGIFSRIYRDRHWGQRFSVLPDGHGGRETFAVQPFHDLRISRASVGRFAASIGFLLERKQARLAELVGRYTRGPYRERFVATFEALTPDGEEIVYDLNVPGVHAFAANGLVVHNCGEQGLPPWGVCNLASIHLAKFVTADREVAWEDLGRAVRYGVRFLDNVIDATPYFFEENAWQQLRERRIGLGTMGLGEMLIRLGIRYGSPESEHFIDRLYEFIATEAYLASADYAAEKGAFPEFDADKLLQSGYMQVMPKKVRAAVKEKGLRNVTLLTQAPTGSTGTMMDTSTGIEPFFSWTYLRKSRLGIHEETVKVAHEWQAQHPGEEWPDEFVTAMDLSPEEHVRVEAAIQRWIDSSISKTANLPADYTVEQTRELYELMYKLGCKGGTVYRDSSRDEQVLMLKPDEAAPATTVVTITATQEPAPVEGGRPKPQRVHLPDERRSVTHKFQVGEQEGYITVGLYDDGQPGEVFLRVSKQGSTVSGLMESLGLLTSVALQYGVPLEGLARKMKNSRFEPYGMTTNREIPTATSLVDYVFRWLEKKFVLGEQLPLLNGGTQAMLALDAPAPATALAEKAHVEHVPSGMGCPECGSLLYHAEGCLICQSCGYTKCG